MYPPYLSIKSVFLTLRFSSGRFFIGMVKVHMALSNRRQMTYNLLKKILDILIMYNSQFLMHQISKMLLLSWVIHLTPGPSNFSN